MNGEFHQFISYSEWFDVKASIEKVRFVYSGGERNQVL